MRKKTPTRAKPKTEAFRLAAAAENARSDRTYRRHVKKIRDNACRTASTTRLSHENRPTPVLILELPDGSLSTITRTGRRGRPNQVSHLTGEDAQMAADLLNSQQPGTSTEEPCCDHQHPPDHCHRLLPQGADCWQCTQAA